MIVRGTVKELEAVALSRIEHPLRLTGHFSTFLVVLARPIDTRPPVIFGVPSDIVTEATSPAGAIVTYAVPTAVDDRDGAVGVVCAPGLVFPLGATTVTCTATDRAGNPASATFSVTVVDTIPPALNLPGDVVTNATSPGGAVVTFDASATDVAGPFNRPVRAGIGERISRRHDAGALHGG